MDIADYIAMYRDNLLDDVVPFWQQHSPDKEHGGYFTCLDRQGNTFDTDKFVWLQGRQIWTFSMLYNELQKNTEWLNMALHGARFLQQYGRDEHGHWYFSLTREGKPLVAPCNIFSDCFAAMGFANLYKATRAEEYAAVALSTFKNIRERSHDPKGKYAKGIPTTRPLKSFSLPMIMSNLVLELEHMLDRALVDEVIQESVHLVMNVFYQEQYGVIVEHTTPEGKFSDSFEGRLVIPGHGLEAMWFIMNIASRNDDHILMHRAVDISLKLMEYGWDKQHGGIFYFLDVKGHPPQQLEWDQKLWWVHQEALLAMLKGYFYTNDERCWKWFKKLHSYTWDHFPDKQWGEWFGYLNRQGEVLLPLKGGKWKGCFHLPRFLFQGWKTLEALTEKKLSVVQ
jgi:N-acylglucosamine 2-epimerase